MPWWSWLVLGLALLGVEMFGIDAQFYLVFLGVSAIVVGLFGLAGIELLEWAQWLLFAALALVTMVTFRKRLYGLVRQRSGHVQERLTLGDRVTVPVQLAPGQTCRIDYRGTTWSARNIGDRTLEVGAEASIVGFDDLTLKIQ